MSLWAVLLCAVCVGFLFGYEKKELAIPAIIWLIAMFLWGWNNAHHEVKRECQRVGAFYVGDTTFICQPDKPQIEETASSRKVSAAMAKTTAPAASTCGEGWVNTHPTN